MQDFKFKEMLLQIYIVSGLLATLIWVDIG